MNGAIVLLIIKIEYVTMMHAPGVEQPNIEKVSQDHFNGIVRYWQIYMWNQ